MKLKNDIRKYMTLGAALAASTFMVSCDGNDGQDGADGVDGINGNSPNLPVAAPTADLLALSQLGVTIEDSASATFTPGDRLLFDFDSSRFGSANLDVNTPRQFSLDTDEAITYTNFSPDLTTFSFDRIATSNSENLDIENAVFEVTTSLNNTLSGRFTALASVITQPVDTRFLSNGDNNANYPTTLQVDGVDVPRDQYQAYYNNAGQIVNFSAIGADNAATALELGDTHIALLVFTEGTAGALYVRNIANQAGAPTDLNITAAELTAADGDQSLYDNVGDYPEWTRVTFQIVTQPEEISGAFTLDFRPAGSSDSSGDN